MTIRNRLVFLCALVSTLRVISTLPSALAQTKAANCPTNALERFVRHKVAPGETLQSIAKRYNLTVESIMNSNPKLRKGAVAAGSEIIIPPFNGMIVEVSPGQTWRQVAAKYKVRADVLFEINGCQPPSKVAFIPAGTAANSSVTDSVPEASTAKLAGYPLAETATVALPYGWQTHPQTGEVFFHSGVDLLAAKGTPVSAIGAGTVAFAGEQGTYGNLVIINHAGGLQSRYAQLDSIKVTVGQEVKQGDLLGTVGTTGKPTSTQPHLHFEVRSSSSLGWVAKDPKAYLQR